MAVFHSMSYQQVLRIVGESRGVDPAGNVHNSCPKVFRVPGGIMGVTGVGVLNADFLAKQSFSVHPIGYDGIRHFAWMVETFLTLNFGEDTVRNLYAVLEPGQQLFAGTAATHDEAWTVRAFEPGKYFAQGFKGATPDYRVLLQMCNAPISNGFIAKHPDSRDPRLLVDFACENFPEICGGEITELTI